jgi:SsrA-binding protein
MEQKNRSITFEYEILSSIEAGIELKSYEIKQIASNHCNIKGSFAKIINNEVFLFDMHIPVYAQAVFYERLDEKRVRKLLLHKKQIKKLHNEMKVNQALTLVPADIYINDKGKCKLTLCLCKGKKLHDKRADIKERDIKRYDERH